VQFSLKCQLIPTKAVVLNLFLLRGPLKVKIISMDNLVCYYVLLADPLIPVKEVQMGTVLYFSDLHGFPVKNVCTKVRFYLGRKLWTPNLKEQVTSCLLACTPGLNFTNIFTAFTPVAPKSVRIQSSCQYLFTLLGSTGAKAAHRTLMKLTPARLSMVAFDDVNDILLPLKL